MTILSTFIAFDAALRDVCSPMQLRHIAAEVEALAKAVAAADREAIRMQTEIAQHRVFLAKWHRRFNESALPAAPHTPDVPALAAQTHAAGGADVHEAAVIPLRPIQEPASAPHGDVTDTAERPIPPGVVTPPEQASVDVGSVVPTNGAAQ